MGLSEKSNGFLPKNEMERTLYNRRKPVFILLLSMFLTFNIVGCIVESLAIGYAIWAYRPVVIDQDKYIAAQKLNTELSQRFGNLKLARPKNINVIVMLAAITDAKPAEVNLTEINITVDKTTISGVTKNLDQANQYCNAISIRDKKVLLDTVKEDNATTSIAPAGGKDIKFTISIIENTKGGSTK